MRSEKAFSDFYFTAFGGFGNGTYTLIDAGAISGSLGGSVTGNIGSRTATLAVAGNDLVLTVVPEPGTMGLLIVAGMALMMAGRRGRKSR